MTIDVALIKGRLKKLIEYEVVDKQIPSISYAIVDGAETISTNHIPKEGAAIKPLSDATVFRVGSCSKMFTAMALMGLAEKGKIDIKADISEAIPWFRPKNPFVDPETGPTEGDRVTLRKLMSHTSGLVREPMIGHYLDDRAPSLVQTIESIKDSTLKDDPKAEVFRYSNAGIAVVGYVLELLTGVGIKNPVPRAQGMHLQKP